MTTTAWKRTLLSFDAVAVGSIALTALMTAALYTRLPDAFPTRFGLHGRVNATMPKPFGPWLLPLVSVAQWLLLRLAIVVLPGEWRERFAASPMAALRLLLSALLCGTQLLCLDAALRPSTSSRHTAVAVGLGIFAIILGQLYPKLRRNPLIGCRTAWTLSSDENWARTHRFGGFTLTIAGLVMMPLALVSPAAALALLVVSALAQYVYSLILAHQLQR